MNSVNLVGNIASDIDYVELDSVTKVNFRVAVNRRGKDDEADFFNITAFGDLANVIYKYQTKGKKVSVTGRLQTREYEKNGERKYFTEVVANDVGFLTPKEG